MPSFDIVSEINMVDVNNATDNATRELSTRFDFRGVEASFTSTDEGVLMVAEAEFQLQQLDSMLRNACSKRGVDTSCMEAKNIEQQHIDFIDGRLNAEEHQKVQNRINESQHYFKWCISRMMGMKKLTISSDSG